MRVCIVCSLPIKFRGLNRHLTLDEVFISVLNTVQSFNYWFYQMPNGHFLD